MKSISLKTKTLTLLFQFAFLSFFSLSHASELPNGAIDPDASPTTKTGLDQYISSRGITILDFETENNFDLDQESDNPLGQYVSFRRKTVLDYEAEYNFDFDQERDNDLKTRERILSLSATVKPHENLKAFLSFRLSKEYELEEGNKEEGLPHRLQISQAYLSFQEILEGFTLTVGRQQFDDEREWLYDRKLDGVRLSYKRGKIRSYFGLSWDGIFVKDLLNISNQRRTDNYLSRIEYYFNEKTKIALYGVYRFDRSAKEDRPFLFGMHSSGDFWDRWRYWMDLAYMKGREKKRTREIQYEGLGFDVGTIYRLDAPLKPAFIMSFAFGSGGNDPDNPTGTGFRQTGLEGNSDVLSGVTSVNYYGELFDPELSNLMIFTTGVGIRPHDSVSLELIYHYYLQHRAHDDLLSSALDSDPVGESRFLGSELDLVLGVRKFKQFDLKASFGLFLPGKALRSEPNEPAIFTGLSLDYTF